MSYPEQSPGVNRRRVSRRLFLQGAGVFSLSLVALSFGSPLVFASEWAYSASEPWQARYWFPLDEDVAARRGIITEHSDGGPMEKYDKLHRHFIGEDSYLKQELAGIAQNYLGIFGDTREWAGYCHGLAHENLLDPEPVIEPETIDVGDEQVTVTYRDRVGVGAAFYSGHIMWRPFLGGGLKTKARECVRENLDWFMDNLITTGKSFIVNAPAPGEEGYWYRAVRGVTTDHNFLQATNFDAPEDKKWVTIGRSEVQEAYFPLSWEDAENQGVDERLFTEIPTVYPNRWRYDDQMNKPLVDRIRYG